MANPINPNLPIPNGPFSSPETWYIQGALGPLITGSGLSVDAALGVIYATGGGGGGGAVNQLLPGPGIALNPTSGTGNVIVCNTGVLNISGGTGISVASSGGNYTITSSATGTVTSIIAGAGLTGGAITTAGTIALNTSCVIPPTAFSAKGQLLASTAAGSYTALAIGSSPNGFVLTTDSTQSTGMRWCAACTGTVTSVTGVAPVVVSTATTTPVISVQAGTTSQQGIVQLVNNTTTSDGTKALTAAQGYALQQQINGLLSGGGLTLAGTFNATTGQLLTVTTAGTGAGFVVGSNIPVAASGNADFFVIITTGGIYTPPGAGSSVNASQGDWLLSTGTAWQYLNTGYDAPAASTSIPGIVQLATSAQTQTGTDTNLAVTPSGAAATYVPLSLYPTKGALAAGGATPNTPVSLTVGTNGQMLVACSACASGLTWVTPSAGVTTATPTVAGTVFGKVDTTCFNYSIGCDSLAATTTGRCNTALGRSAGTRVTSGTGNVLLGTDAGCQITTGSVNIAVGLDSLSALTTGLSNIVIGGSAGGALTTENGNLLLGGFAGTAGCCNNVWIANGAGNVRIEVNCQGAFAFSGSGFGTSGQVLQSQGNALPPVWASATTPFATPTALGTVLGVTPLGTGLTTVALGLCAGGVDVACVINRTANVAIGHRAGSCQGLAAAGDGFNTMVGACAGFCNCGTYNILLGANAGRCLVGSESCNLIIGSNGCSFVGCNGMFLLASPAAETPGTNSGAPFIYGNACGAISFRTSAAVNTIDGCYGTSGQFLQSRGNADSPTWAALPIATRTSVGMMFGSTDISCNGTNTFLGRCITFTGASPGACNTLLGACVGGGNFRADNSNSNTIVGSSAAWRTCAGFSRNTIIGSAAGGDRCTGASIAVSGCDNVLIGNCVWPDWGSTNSNFNVIIGSCLNPPDPAGGCQLAIGISSIGSGIYWLTGCSNGNIRPGRGILDVSGSAGSNGQYLSSTGTNGVEWRNITFSEATPTVPGTIRGFSSTAANNTNTALGTRALFIGTQNLASSTGNTLVGYNSGFELGANFGECNNTGVGAFALGGETVDTRFNGTTALGFCAGYLNVSTSAFIGCNVYVGFCTAIDRGDGSQCNTIVGALAGNGGNGRNNTLLGWCAQTTLPASCHEIVLGNANNTVIRAAVTTITALSDGRDKKDVAQLTAGIDFVKDLKPVTFKWDHRDPEVTARRGFPDMGFIAQDMLETEIKHGTKNHTQLVHDSNPDQLEASYGRLIPVLVKAIQDLAEEVERLKAKVGE